MRGLKMLLLFILTLLGVLSSYTLSEDELALVVRLGKVVGAPVREAGLHWKLPIVDELIRIDARLQTWEGARAQVPTRDKKFVSVETTARWRVQDPLVFYRSVRDKAIALQRMGPILEGASKDIISAHPLSEAVRNTNDVLQRVVNVDDDEVVLLGDETPRIQYGREQLSLLIAERAMAELAGFGVELVDVQLRSVAYQESVEAKVFESMIAERQQISTKIRSQGRAEQARILGEMEKSRSTIESKSYREAQRIKSLADGEVARMYAEVWGKDPELFAYIKSLESYKEHLKSLKGGMILSTGNEYFKVFQSGSKGPQR